MSSPVRSVMNGVQGFRLLRRVYILFAILCCTASVTAQIQVEYFWGTDKGLGKCTRVDGSAEIGGVLNFKLPTGELPYGISCLGVRAFVESDTATYYSSTLYSYIVKTIDSEISEIEYFWNNDPGLGNATAVLNGKLEPGSEFFFSLPTDTLSPGIHCLGIRAKDLAWSPTVYSYIVKPGKNSSVTAVEYFWDNDPGFGKATKLAGGTAAPGESLTFSIPTDTLSPGIHCLGIRAKDLAWSPAVYSLVLVETQSSDVYAQYIEYFWDEDPGFGNGMHEVLQPDAAGNEVSFEISTSGLQDGVHTLHVRTKAVGWSPVTHYYVRVHNGKVETIVDVEYFWDEDPGYGNGFKIPFEQGSSVDIKDFEPYVEGLTGEHTFCLRAHSAGGWSVVYFGNILFAAEGAYTLNDTSPIDLERNFVSLDDFFAYVDTVKVVSDVRLDVVDGGNFVLDVTDEELLGLMERVTGCFIENQCWLELKSSGTAAVDLIVDQENFSKALDFCMHISTENVSLRINGDSFDFGLLQYNLDEVCHGGLSEIREWGEMSAGVDVNWSLSSVGGGNIEGALDSGSGNLPVMNLFNSSLYTDSLSYKVVLSYKGMDFGNYEYKIYVRPALYDKSLTFLEPSPSSGAVVNPGSVNFKWTALEKGIFYRMILETVSKSDGSVICDTLTLESNTFSLMVSNGYDYRYKVMAVGPCDSSEYVADSISAFDISSAELASLRVMYETLDGQLWSRRWMLDKEDISSSYFPGVGFDKECRVTSINLESNNVVGSLPSDGFILAELKEMKLGKNRLTGDISAFVDGCGMLESIDLSYNNITDISMPLPQNVESMLLANQFRKPNGTVSDEISILPLNDIMMNVNCIEGLIASNVAWYVHKDRNFDGRPSFIVWDRSLKNKLGDLTYSGDSYKLNLYDDYVQEQGISLLLEVGNGDSKGSLYPARFSYVPGDANIDTALDITDVQHLLNYIVGPNGAQGAFNSSASNLHSDDMINVQDVVVMVNMLLEGNIGVKSRAKRADSNVEASGDSDAYLYLVDGNVVLKSDCGIAALDIELAGVKSNQLKSLLGNVFDVVVRDTDTGCRVVIISLTGAIIQSGTTLLMSVANEASILNAMVADAAAMNVPLSVNNGNITSLDEMIVPDGFSVKTIDDEVYIDAAQMRDNVDATVYSIDGRVLYRFNGLSLQPGLNKLETGRLCDGVYLIEIVLEKSSRIVLRLVIGV